MRRLVDVSKGLTGTTNASGPFSFMVVFFLWKQTDHADAILRLGTHRDTELIARSMIEGLCQLKWAAQDPDVRGDRWRRFAWVHDWRLLQKRLQASLPVSADERRRIELGVEQYGKDFKTRKARAKVAKGATPPADPYVAHWAGAAVAELCAAVGGTPLYDWPYAHFSDWHHWSPGAILTATRRETNRLSFTQPEPQDAFPTYVVAFQCLFETVELANKRLDLGIGEQLAAMLQAYLRDLAPAGAEATRSAQESDA